MAMGSSSSSTPLSTLGAGGGVKSSAGLVLDTTLGGGLADFCLRCVYLNMDGLRRWVLLGWWCKFGGGQVIVAPLVSAIYGMLGIALI